MNTSSFKLYDLIVDIAPGIVVIGVLVPLFPAGSIVESLIDPSSFAFGVWVLFISYVVGRLVHGASSEIYDWCGWASNDAEWFAENVRRRATSKVPNVQNSLADSIIGRSCSDDDSVPLVGTVGLGNSTVDVRLDRVGSSENTEDDKIETDERTENTDLKPSEKSDLERLHVLGENILYNSGSLYHKYEMLATFYRSLTLVSAVAAFLYFGHIAISALCLLGVPCGLTYTTAWADATTSAFPDWFFVIPILSLASGTFLCRRRRRKFISKRREAFINDLALALAERGEQSGEATD